GAWARRIAVNVAIDHMKKRGRGEQAFRDIADPRSTGAVDAVDARRAITSAFRALPAALYVTAVLALVDERSYQEIADVLGISVGAVKSRMFRATRLLRRELTRLGWQP